MIGPKVGEPLQPDGCLGASHPQPSVCQERPSEM